MFSCVHLEARAKIQRLSMLVDMFQKLERESLVIEGKKKKKKCGEVSK